MHPQYVFCLVLGVISARSDLEPWYLRRKTGRNTYPDATFSVVDWVPAVVVVVVQVLNWMGNYVHDGVILWPLVSTFLSCQVGFLHLPRAQQFVTTSIVLLL